MLNDAEKKLLGAGYYRLPAEYRHEILGMAEALDFVQKTGGLKHNSPGTERNQAEEKNRGGDTEETGPRFTGRFE